MKNLKLVFISFVLTLVLFQSCTNDSSQAILISDVIELGDSKSMTISKTMENDIMTNIDFEMTGINSNIFGGIQLYGEVERVGETFILDLDKYDYFFINSRGDGTPIDMKESFEQKEGKMILSVGGGDVIQATGLSQGGGPLYYYCSCGGIIGGPEGCIARACTQHIWCENDGDSCTIGCAGYLAEGNAINPSPIVGDGVIVQVLIQ